MDPKFRLEQDAGKFSETPLEYDRFRKAGKNTRYPLFKSLGMKNPATPERNKRLSKIAKALNKSLSRYVLDSKPHNPSLIAWDPVLYTDRMSDPWGALYTDKRDQVHIRLFLMKLIDDEQKPDRIKDEAVGYIYAHELIHLYSARTWMVEEGENQQKEEKLSRSGLVLMQGKGFLWQWMNEAVIDDLTREEYPQIENYANPDNPLYDFYIQQFDAMTKALAKNSSQN